MINLTFLGKKYYEWYRDNPKMIVEASDFAILLGCYAYRKRCHQWIDGSVDGCVYIADGSKLEDANYSRKTVGIRPAICDTDSLTELLLNGVCKKKRYGELEIKYGYYPQTAVSLHRQVILENEYNKGNVVETGNKYTINSTRYNSEDKFIPQEILEYEFEGNRYVRVKANFCFNDDSEIFLSNGCGYKNGDYVWVKVKPVKWKVDTFFKIAYTKKVIFSGIPYDMEYNVKLDKPFAKYFMNNILIKEILQPRNVNEKEMDVTRKSKCLTK